jgi:hypothetical protein
MGRKLDSGGEAPIHIAFATESHSSKPPATRADKPVVMVRERKQSLADPISDRKSCK